MALRAWQAEMEIVGFTVIVDDIVLPNGETCMEVLGGGGPQTLWGYQLATFQTAKAGLSAGIGADCPQKCLDWLARTGVDTSGLVLHPRPTPRAWQVFEEWGRRTQVWRGRDDPCDELYNMLRPRYDTMPPAFQRSSNYHLGIHPLHPPMRLLAALRAAAHSNGGVLSVEPYTAAEEPATPQQVVQLLSACDIFSPNEAEAESLVGPGPPEELAARLLALSPAGGADVVVVRCGPEGVLAARRETDGRVTTYQVPAVADTHVVDVTGCGNAFCGGFLAALYRNGQSTATTTTNSTTTTAHTNGSGSDSSAATQAAATAAAAATPPPAWLYSSDLPVAGAWGCVAASFMAEARGVPTVSISSLRDRAEERFRALLPRVRPVKLPGTRGSGRAAAGAGAAVQVRAAGAVARGGARAAAAAAARVVRQGETIRRAVRGPAASVRAVW